jgi:hypothetical protein
VGEVGEAGEVRFQNRASGRNNQARSDMRSTPVAYGASPFFGNDPITERPLPEGCRISQDLNANYCSCNKDRCMLGF